MTKRRRRKHTPGSAREDLTDRKFGRLIVKSLSHVDDHRHGHWRCTCECGAQRVIVRDQNLKAPDGAAGATRSCGCWRADPAVRQAAWTARRQKRSSRYA